jgi:cyclase
MPLCYGGGINKVEQASKIIELGVEKVALSSAIIQNTSLISSIVKTIGSQSVVAVIDVKKKFFGGYTVFTNNGKKKIDQDLVKTLNQIEDSGAGEIVINSIDNDGVMKGYDLTLIKKVREAVSIPITALGGAGSKEHIFELVNRFKIIGAAAGSLFVFKGIYKAVLINYFTKSEINKLDQNL